jgi:hypothetical protein
MPAAACGDPIKMAPCVSPWLMPSSYRPTGASIGGIGMGSKILELTTVAQGQASRRHRDTEETCREANPAGQRKP